MRIRGSIGSSIVPLHQVSRSYLRAQRAHDARLHKGVTAEDTENHTDQRPVGRSTTSSSELRYSTVHPKAWELLKYTDTKHPAALHVK